LACKVCGSEKGVRKTGKCNTCYAREWRRANPEKSRSNDLKKDFGITLADYNVILESQGYVCAICGKQEVTRHNNTDRVRNLAVDHSHSTGKVRGLLCTACNQGLGNFKENLDSLAKAMSYLIENGP
jgi:hypothetical protein